MPVSQCPQHLSKKGDIQVSDVSEVPACCPPLPAFVGILCLGTPEFHVGPVLCRQVLAFVFALSMVCWEYTIVSCLIK